MILYGASGHGLVIQDIVENEGGKVDCFIDNDASKTSFNSVKVHNDYQAGLYPNSEMIISIGDCRIRQLIAATITHRFATVISSKAIVANDVCVGKGSVIFQGSVIQTKSVIGEHCIINTSASIDHECEINDFCHIAPNATLCGMVVVGKGTFIGAGATVVQCISIGQNAIVGAGAVVITDVPDNAVVVGNPARIIKYLHD